MEAREPVSLSRAVEVTLVPPGRSTCCPRARWSCRSRSLGGHFHVMLDRGGLARLANEDAEALGPAYAERARKVAEAEKARLDEASGQPFDEQEVWEALKKVFDPEIPASIVDLGLVYELIHVRAPRGRPEGHHPDDPDRPGCGVAPMILDDVRERVAKVPGVAAVDVDLVFDPPVDSREDERRGAVAARILVDRRALLRAAREQAVPEHGERPPTSAKGLPARSPRDSGLKFRTSDAMGPRA